MHRSSLRQPPSVTCSDLAPGRLSSTRSSPLHSSSFNILTLCPLEGRDGGPQHNLSLPPRPIPRVEESLDMCTGKLFTFSSSLHEHDSSLNMTLRTDFGGTGSPQVQTHSQGGGERDEGPWWCSTPLLPRCLPPSLRLLRP